MATDQTVKRDAPLQAAAKLGMDWLHDSPLHLRKVGEHSETHTVRYSICTLVTRPGEYSEMLASFAAKGFKGDDCEFLYLDNSASNKYDAFSGYNLFLNIAVGEYIVLCHQDVRLEYDDRAKLELVLADLDALDENWAICGNAGGVSLGKLALRLTDPHGDDQKTDRLPSRVLSLDENFIIVKRQANLALSRDLAGFHLYGADLCLIAAILGWSAYVVDFHLHHLSGGSRDPAFGQIRHAFIDKYSKMFRSRWITTTCTIMFLSGLPLLPRVLNSPLATRIINSRPATWIIRRLAEFQTHLRA